MKGKFFLAVVVCLFFAFSAKAQDSLKFIENESNIIFNEKTADISFVIEFIGLFKMKIGK